MSQSQDKDPLLDKVKITLDNAVEELDLDTLARLRAVRREVLSVNQKKHRPAWFYPLSGLATAATVAALSVLLWTAPHPEQQGIPSMEDIALLSDAEELEFYENLEFYLWVEGEGLDGHLDKQKRDMPLLNEAQKMG